MPMVASSAQSVVDVGFWHFAYCRFFWALLSNTLWAISWTPFVKRNGEIFTFFSTNKINKHRERKLL